MALTHSILSRLSRNKVTILNFHKIPSEIEPVAPNEPSIHEFKRIVEMILKLFPIVGLHEAVESINSRTLQGGAVCLTLDDGYVDWLETVVPFLKQRNLPATFFVTTGQIDGQPLWHERVRAAIEQAHESCVDITDEKNRRRISLFSMKERVRIVTHFERHLKSRTIGERDELIRTLEEDAGSNLSKIRRISGAQIKAIHDAGFEIGAHSVNHPILSQCTMPQAQAEIFEPKNQIEEITGCKVRYFAYPNGRRSDFNSRHVDCVRQAGYEYALTTEGGTLNCDSNKYEIPRFTPWGPSPKKLSWQLGRNLLI